VPPDLAVEGAAVLDDVVMAVTPARIERAGSTISV